MTEIARQAVLEAIEGRRAIRDFLPDPVPEEVVRRILIAAARAPSGSNIQPWQVIVLTGSTLRAFGEELEAYELSGGAPSAEFHYYPHRWREPYLARRRKVGWDLYGALGIERGEREATARQHARNLRFFGAPVGMIITMDRDMEIGSWLDLGMFMQNVMIAARAFGLETCPQAAFARHAGRVAAMLGVAEDRQVICGLALGHASPQAPEHRFATERLTVEEFARFLT